MDKKKGQIEKHSQHGGWNTMYTGQACDYDPPDPKILLFLENLNTGKALDVGCGAGGLCITLAKRGGG